MYKFCIFFVVVVEFEFNQIYLICKNVNDFDLNSYPFSFSYVRLTVNFPSNGFFFSLNCWKTFRTTSIRSIVKWYVLLFQLLINTNLTVRFPHQIKSNLILTHIFHDRADFRPKWLHATELWAFTEVASCSKKIFRKFLSVIVLVIQVTGNQVVIVRFCHIYFSS